MTAQTAPHAACAATTSQGPEIVVDCLLSFLPRVLMRLVTVSDSVY